MAIKEIASRYTILTLALMLSATIMQSSLMSQRAGAVGASDWRPGRIIDDAVFYNKNSMSATQIQDFLNAKVPTCDRWRASSNPSYQPPWTCLKEYLENPTTRENNVGRFNPNGTPYQVPGGKSAAQIIWDVAQEYGINPQVLIVMLQKEQGLITDNWPWAVQYQKAMGYACPDTAPCDTQYYGFYNQVSSAAWQMKRYIAYPNSYNFKAGVSRYIQYNPNISCGGSQVFIENAATAALYNYTPYQPNQSALNNLYGSGDSCGAYGNRNFWRYFNDWFGSVYTNCYGGGFTSYGIYRLYNKSTGGALLTTNGCEASSAKDSGFMFDAQLFQSSGYGIPIYRLVRNGSYLYTSSYSEAISAGQFGFKLEGIAFNGDADGSSGGKPVYRLRSALGGYQYTLSEYEKNQFMNMGYALEGVVFYAQENPNNSVVDTFRLAHPNGVYLYTTSEAEKNIAAQNYGYRIEGVGFKAITQLNTMTIPMYRLANARSYLYTTSLAERVYATSIGYRDEGIVMYTYGAQNDPSLTPMYRLVGRSGGYLYTSSSSEIYSAVNAYGYKLEGMAFRTP